MILRELYGIYWESEIILKNFMVLIKKISVDEINWGGQILQFFLFSLVFEARVVGFVHKVILNIYVFLNNNFEYYKFENKIPNDQILLTFK